MRFQLLATDYDGTLADGGKVDNRTLEALGRLRASGRRLVLITGRHLPSLRGVFPHLDLFDRVVAENGALLFRPATGEEKDLCDQAPDPRFVSLLEERRVPVSLGRAIVSTWEPYDKEVLAAIRDLGLDLQVTFNKGAVMVLPSTVNKGSGLKAALEELCISPHNVVGVGDAENDHSFLRISECAVAVANALPALQERADVVLEAPTGAGAVDLVERLLADDLAQFEPRLRRHAISLGNSIQPDARQVLLGPGEGGVLIAGPSGSGKSTLIFSILEQLAQHDFQFCLLDPEGDYEEVGGVVPFGTVKEPPDSKAALRALMSANQNVLMTLLRIPVDERPAFFASLAPHLQELLDHCARPHWLVLDEAHHLLPSEPALSGPALSQIVRNSFLVTVHPEHIAKPALDAVNVVVAVGRFPREVFRSFCNAVQVTPPSTDGYELATGEALVWIRNSGEAPIHVKTPRSPRERQRHARQYAEGELSPGQSFYFRGPESKSNLRAQNLRIFLQLAEGVDDVTWMYHLRRGDYSEWFKSMIKDAELASCTAEVEGDATASPQQSRQRIKEAVERRYTAPA